VQDLLEVHVGTFTPTVWDERVRVQADIKGLTIHEWVRGLEARPRIATEDIDWTNLGLEPRWVGEDTSTAVAAIEPSGFSEKGAEEWRRFQAGATARSELALYISTAEPSGGEPRPALYSGVERVDFPYLGLDHFHIHGESIRLARSPELAEGLSATDKDLALRIRNDRPLDREWVAFKPVANRTLSGSGFGQEQEGSFFGTWTQLLVTPDGRTVAGVWSDDGILPNPVRHYVLPDMPSYKPILQWLVERAVPDLIPTAAARTRRNVDLQPELQTARERQLTEDIAALTAQYEETKADLEQQLAQERADASPVRDAMLFGTGSALESAVARVLADAGLSVERLDEELGTISGDLLVERAGQRILVEVKSAGGNAPERLAGALQRHQQTWPELRPDQPLAGTALVVNHQHKQPPAQRSAAVYQRREFVDSLEHPVVSTTELFDAWRRGDWLAICEAVGFRADAAAARPRALAPEEPPSARDRRAGGWRAWGRKGG
jgi:hypothetical protein